MRLIVIYWTGDGCSYGFPNTIPVLAESKERLYLDMQQHIQRFEASKDKTDLVITCGNYEIDLQYCIINGTFDPPEIYTVDEWFQQN